MNRLVILLVVAVAIAMCATLPSEGKIWLFLFINFHLHKASTHPSFRLKRLLKHYPESRPITKSLLYFLFPENNLNYYLPNQWIVIFASFDCLPWLGISLAVHCFATGAKMVSGFETFLEDKICVINEAVVQTNTKKVTNFGLSVFTGR